MKRGRRLAARVAECALLCVLAVTVLARLAAELPASGAAIARVIAQARGNPDAMDLVADALSRDPSPSESALQDLRRKVAATGRTDSRRVSITGSNVGSGSSTATLAMEAQRLAAIPFVDMSAGDQIRWCVLWLGRALPAVVAALLALGLWTVLPRLRTRGRSSVERIRAETRAR